MTLCATAGRHLTSQGRPQPKQPESGLATGIRSILLCQSLHLCWPESPRILLLAGGSRDHCANILLNQTLFCSCLRSSTPLSIGTSVCRCGLPAIAAGQQGQCENACLHDGRHDRQKKALLPGNFSCAKAQGMALSCLSWCAQRKQLCSTLACCPSQTWSPEQQRPQRRCSKTGLQGHVLRTYALPKPMQVPLDLLIRPSTTQPAGAQQRGGGGVETKLPYPVLSKPAPTMVKPATMKRLRTRRAA